MNKMQMAHEWAMKHGKSDTIGDRTNIILYAWDYADAMQAEAEKRINKERPDVLCEVDWRVAPSWAKYWAVRDGGSALWCTSKPTCTDDCLMSHGACGPAPSFGFTGTHIMERPQ